MFDNFEKFIDEVFSGLKELGIDVSLYEMDHIAFQTASSKEYESKRDDLKASEELCSENFVRGRRVAIFRLKNILKYKGQTIDAIEIVEPKPEQICPSALEHVEFVVSEPFEEIVARYPHIEWNTAMINAPEFAKLQLILPNGLGVKFHHDHILKEIPAKV